MTIEPSAEVRRALADGAPIVALETTIISHGLPRGRNLEVAIELERIVRDEGAVPATIGILDGCVRVGLTIEELTQLAEDDDVLKCSTRDLAACVAQRRLGATTVAATIFAAARSGIRIMATGGLGGVHIGGHESFDISADIAELGRTPIIVVCSGAKAILDIEKTIEALETAGVAIYGYGVTKLPGFYVRETAVDVPSIGSEAGLAAIARAHHRLGTPGSIVVANPPPETLALSPETFSDLLQRSLAAADRQGVAGKAVTPFLLRSLAELSDGRTVELNAGLVESNVRLAARLAVLSAIE